MGKASRWLTNFLLGKKEERNKKIEDGGRSEDPTSIVTPTPPYKRRWSFGKSSGKDKVHKSFKSLDSIGSLRVIKPVVTPNRSADAVCSKSVVENADAAATRIQAAYRAHLARKALCALRGLVKLQALVRGHLVRKQTTATLRQMHALMAIQVRARFQRIQMAGDSRLVVKSQSLRHGNFCLQNGFSGAQRVVDVDLRERHGKREKYLNLEKVARMEQGKTRNYSGDLYISRREHHSELSFSSARNSPQTPKSYSKTTGTIPGRASFSYQKPDYLQPVSHQHLLVPSYMANTESSKAKTRSQSEPKQRPKWGMIPQSNRTASMDGMNARQESQMQCSPSSSSSQLKCAAQDNQDPWFIKLYRSTKSKKSRDYDGKSTTSTRSNDNKFLVTYEPHLNLY